MAEKTVWVTGASSGLGMYTAKALADTGWQVIAGARSFTEAKNSHQDGIIRLSLDVTDQDSITAFVIKATKISSRVDGLINCAGILVLGSCEETGIAQYRQVLGTNFLGMVAMVQAVLPIMRTQNHGKIINFSSINGVLGVPFQSAYTAAKHAMEGYSECLSMETKPFHIQVCLVEPGDHRGGSQAYRQHATAMEHSPYAKNYQSAVAAIAHDEAQGSDPNKLGVKVAGLMNRKRLPFRRVIAKPDQHLAVWIHRLLPPKVLARVLSLYYFKSNKGTGKNKHIPV